MEEKGSSDERSTATAAAGFEEPEIEVRVVSSNILLKIHCRKQKGILSKLVCKVESLNMVVVNTGVTPFGNSALDISIIAESEIGFSLTVREVATAIRATFRQSAT